MNYDQKRREKIKRIVYNYTDKKTFCECGNEKKSYDEGCKECMKIEARRKKVIK